MRRLPNAGAVLEPHLRVRPHAVAVVDAELSWTFEELDRMAEGLARQVVATGLRPGETIGVLLDNVPESVASYLGLARAGAVQVRLNTRFTSREVDYHLRDSDAVGLLISESLWDRIGDVLSTLPRLRRVWLVPSRGRLETALHDYEVPDGMVLDVLDPRHLPAGPDLPTVKPDDACIVWYTSGTTGEPKGAVHTHRACLEMSAALIEPWDLGPDEVTIALNLFHVGMQARVIGMLAAGGRLVMYPGDFSIERFLDVIEKHRVTFIAAFQVVLALMDQRPHVVDAVDLSSLTKVNYGAASTDRALLRRVMGRLAWVDWYHTWGQSESGACSFTLTPEFHDTKLGSVGLPNRAVEDLQIVDGEDRPLPTGELGELCVRGRGMMTKYYERPEATATVFRDGWLHTGDLGRVDEDGFLWFVGRRKDLIIRGGENVYPAEVEAVLNAASGVAEAVVVGAPDSVMGEVPVAFVVPTPGGPAPDVEELKRAASEKLASYKCPVLIEMVEEVPHNRMGKVDRQALEKAAAAYSR